MVISKCASTSWKLPQSVKCGYESWFPSFSQAIHNFFGRLEVLKVHLWLFYTYLLQSCFDANVHFKSIKHHIYFMAINDLVDLLHLQR